MLTKNAADHGHEAAGCCQAGEDEVEAHELVAALIQLELYEVLCIVRSLPQLLQPCVQILHLHWEFFSSWIDWALILRPAASPWRFKLDIAGSS